MSEDGRGIETVGDIAVGAGKEGVIARGRPGTFKQKHLVGPKQAPRQADGKRPFRLGIGRIHLSKQSPALGCAGRVVPENHARQQDVAGDGLQHMVADRAIGRQCVLERCRRGVRFPRGHLDQPQPEVGVAGRGEDDLVEGLNRRYLRQVAFPDRPRLTIAPGEGEPKNERAAAGMDVRRRGPGVDARVRGVVRIGERVGDPGGHLGAGSRLLGKRGERGVTELHRREPARDLAPDALDGAAVEVRVGRQHGVAERMTHAFGVFQVADALRGVGPSKQPADAVQQPAPLARVLGAPFEGGGRGLKALGCRSPSVGALGAFPRPHQPLPRPPIAGLIEVIGDRVRIGAR
ncbi:MAG: hypothetical protein H0U10_17340 [Chloroflexia bacterium]|nr:hypothetical protein [Chloroflexia bacterium]